MNLLGAFRTMAPLALAPMTGGASLGLQALATQAALRAFGAEVLSFAAKELGVPSSMLNGALVEYGRSSSLGGFDTGSLGSFRDVQEARNWLQVLQKNGGSAIEIARAQREFREAVQDAKSEVKDILRQQLDQMNRNAEKRRIEKEMKTVLGGKGSILMKIAVIMGMVADKKLGDMLDKASQIGAMGEIKGKNQAKFTQMNAEMGAMGQEFSIISQAMNTVIKTIGEAQAQIARKS